MRNYVLVVEKSEAISPCKEMLVIPINKVVDKKKIIGTNGSKVEERHKGLQTQKTSKFCSVIMYLHITTLILPS
jgi:hypothetical protein